MGGFVQEYQYNCPEWHFTVFCKVFIRPIAQLVKAPKTHPNSFPNPQNEKRALAIPLKPLFLLSGPTWA